MQNQQWFKDWFNTKYYHILYDTRNEAEAALFIDRLIKHIQPKPDARMLDIACGKGRHAIQLSKKGFDVTGIDLSTASIDVALTQANDHLHFFVHDMRLPFMINYFDYAFNFFTSFGYFDTQREHNNSIRSIAQSLHHKGLLVIDFFNAVLAEKNIIAHQSITKQNITFNITKWSDENHIYKQIEFTDSATQENFIHREKVAKFTLDNFKTMFSANRLRIKEVFGDYELNSFNPEISPRLIIIAEKQ